jgi:glyoxylase-like metal-dependent hydrolase (beta-lactamase superfamily II)
MIRTQIAITMLALTTGIVSAEDAKPILQNATKVIGGTNLNSVRYTGTGRAYTLGQSFTPTSPWPGVLVTSYTRTIDYASESSSEELTRTQENPPAKGGGAPFAVEQKQVNRVSGPYAWNQPGSTPQPALATADERRLQIWLTPHGFLKAALAGNATAKSANKATVVSFTALEKFKVRGTINSQNLVEKVETWIPNPVLGDLLVETSYSDYKDFSGIQYPTRIVQKQGGYPVLDLTVSSVQPNPENAALQVPDSVRQATLPPVTVASQQLGDGVWFLGGGSHNSVLVEFKDFVAVVEAPLNEERSLAVIAEVKKLVPNKPIKYVINTHHHFDHSGGLRTYVAEGATIITQEANRPFYEQAWKAPRTLSPDKLSQSRKKAAFVTVKDSYTLTDGAQSLELHLVQGDAHNADILLGFLPKQKILIEADDFTPPAANAPPLVPLAAVFGNNLYANIQRLKLDVVTIAPLHGNVAPFSEFPKALGKT